MNANDLGFDQRIEQLLATPEYASHPLREALHELWQHYLRQAHRLDRITHLSDNYQAMARRNELSRIERFEKQLRQLEKVTRISDHYQEMMRELNVALTQASTHDMLTGLANRRLLGQQLRSEADRSERQDKTFCVALIDIDRFKSVNDTYGHDTGDEVLIAVAHSLQAGVREYDVCGRWGGEEFLLLLPATRTDEAAGVVERVREAVRQVGFAAHPDLHLTISVGLSEHRRGEGPEATVSRADSALLQAKREGRDRCVLA